VAASGEGFHAHSSPVLAGWSPWRGRRLATRTLDPKSTLATGRFQADLFKDYFKSDGKRLSAIDLLTRS
jgi:hypothetical protein